MIYALGTFAEVERRYREWAEKGSYVRIDREHGPYCSRCGAENLVIAEILTAYNPYNGKRKTKTHSRCPNKTGRFSRHTNDEMFLPNEFVHLVVYENALDVISP